MTNSATNAENHVTTLLAKHGITNVGIIDDDYIPLEQLEISSYNAENLWAAIQNEDTAFSELESFDDSVVGFEQITITFICKFLSQRNKYPALDKIWRESELGIWIDQRTALLDPIKNHLEKNFNLKVQTFTPGDEINDTSINIFFLDWHLNPSTTGVDIVEPAVRKAKEIFTAYEARQATKPLVVLMSSRPGVVEEKDDFRKRSGLLGGMFYAVHKQDLRDLFKLTMNLQMYALSLPVGHHMQDFVDSVCKKIDEVKSIFTEHIKELTLNDYAFIQSLCLQEEGEPLGSYMFWLFSSYFSYLLFDKGLKDTRDKLNVADFTHAIPIHTPPSIRLAEIYQHALFDTEVGTVSPHPKIPNKVSDPDSIEPYLSLGDVFLGQTTQPTPLEQAITIGEELEESLFETTNNLAVIENKQEIPPITETEKSQLFSISEQVTPTDNELVKPNKPLTESPSLLSKNYEESLPKLYMIINNECDLTFTPNKGKRKIDSEQAILLIEGELQPVSSKENRGPRTELFTHENQAYRIIWEPKKVRSIHYGSFMKWYNEANLDRKARLRLPFALEIQRSFAADLTRVGLPVAPPIYRQANIKLLLQNGGNFEEVHLDDAESAGIISIRDGSKFMLTLSLVEKIRNVLSNRYEEGKEGKRNPVLANVLNDFQQWGNLWISQHNLPSAGKLQSLLNPDWVLMLGNGLTDEDKEKKAKQKILIINIDPTN
ncbi:MAG: hypothetical protein HXX08_14630 [Chloroflexi bacterium]|uniref:Uncharacterized protein n=1 Tax=Candidatus Chlorohelix allophototropha TaxID=3003348 RepID=A0A8T7M4T0_9CHLR|nr:hypothetical protein [Chloroflexota bacterium]WJW70407.1 hypothetical protein OZ401_004984 [Chloroflexota bacterium L227-S17]